MRQCSIELLFERIAIDTDEPFPVVDNGNCYIMGIGDYFLSGWKLMQFKTTVAKAVVYNYCAVYRVSMKIHTNQRKECRLGNFLKLFMSPNTKDRNKTSLSLT